MKQNHVFKKVCLIVTVFLCIIFMASTVCFAGGTPKAVLDARAGVARVVCEYPGEGGIASGSGFAVGDSDYVDFIVTNYHVVEGDPSEIIVVTDSNMQTKATVYATRPSSDLAILQLEQPIDGLKPLYLDTGDVENNIGAEVYALGFPGAADYIFDEADTFSEQVSITSGIISSVKPFSGYTNSTKSVQTYQMDVPISAGNSGGPLLNGAGGVVGINAFTLSPEGKIILNAENINGAISSLELKYFLDDEEIGYMHNESFPIWIPIVIVAAVAALIVFLWMKKRKRSKGTMKKKGKGNLITLSEYLGTMHEAITFDTAIRILAPVAYRLAQMNAQMQWYANVTPDNIQIDPSTGLAQLKEQPQVAVSSGNVVISPGYSPLEKYRADIADGGYTDVFGLAAVLYRLLFRIDPPEIFSRMQNDQVVANNINSLPVYDSYKKAFLKCLNPDPRERFQNVGEMITALSIAPPQAAPQQNTAWTETAAGTEAAPAKKRKKKLLWLIPIGAAAAVAIVLGVLFTQNSGMVKSAEKLLEQERYAQAVQKYDDAYFLSAGDNANYALAQAGAAFQNEEYEKALEYLKDAEGVEQAEQLKKDIAIAYSDELYYDDKTDEALEILKPYEGEKEFNEQIANIICREADWQFGQDEDETGYEWLGKLPDTQEARAEIKAWAPAWVETWYTEAGDYEKTIGILQHIPFQDEKRVKDAIEAIVLSEAAYAFEISDFAHVSELMVLLEDNEEYTGMSDVYKAMDLFMKGEFGEARTILYQLIDAGIEGADEVLEEINNAEYLGELITGWWYNPTYFYTRGEDGWATDLPLTNEASYQRIEDGKLCFVNDSNEPVVIYEIWKLIEDELVLKSESGEMYEFERVG